MRRYAQMTTVRQASNEHALLPTPPQSFAPRLCIPTSASIRTSWCPWFNNARYDDGDGKRSLAAATAASCVLPQKDLGTASTSRVIRETDHLIDKPKRSAQAEDGLGGDGPGETKPPGLLEQPHIRNLLVTDGIYSVG